MPRRREVPKREILPDPKFNNVDLAKFVNVLMTRGKKSVAERIIYGALDTIKQKSGKDPLEVFSQAVQNVKPIVEVKSRRVGGANYQVSHRFSTVRMADRILVLQGGELIEQGTHEALVAHGGLYAELFQLQAAGYR